MVEAGGQLYVRDDQHRVHEISDDLDTHDGEPIAWSLRTPFIGKDSKARLWQFLDVRFDALGTFAVYGYPNYSAPDVRDHLGRQDGPSNPFDRMFLPYATQSVAFGLEGTGHFTFDAFSLRLNRLMI
jgi:hypothetical protein